MGYDLCNFFLQKVCAATSKKMGKKQQSNKTAKKCQKISSSKKYFSENYAYFLPILTLGERKKGVVLMGD